MHRKDHISSFGRKALVTGKQMSPKSTLYIPQLLLENTPVFFKSPPKETLCAGVTHIQGRVFVKIVGAKPNILVCR